MILLPAVLTEHPKKWVSKGLKKVFWPFNYFPTLGRWSRIENLPNQLTVLRLFMGLFFFLAVFINFFDLAMVVYVMAMTTDFLDGYIARRNGQISNFGRIFDPIADKLIICGGFVLFLSRLPILQSWMVITIITRELLISFLRGYLELNGVNFPSNLWGKLKMALQSFTLGVLVFIAGHSQPQWILMGVGWLLWLTVILTVLSSFPYIVQAWHLLMKKPTQVRINKKPYGIL